MSITFPNFRNKKEILRWLAGVASVAVVIIPIFFYRSLASIKDVGYVGYFVANYFGYGFYILPFLITKLNPIVLILIGAFGSTVDEFFAWYFGQTTEKFENKSKSHEIVEKYITKHGLSAIFIMAVLPLPGYLYTIAGYVGGHYGIAYKYYFLAGLGGRLIRNVIYTIGVLYMIHQTGWLK